MTLAELADKLIAHKVLRPELASQRIYNVCVDVKADRVYLNISLDDMVLTLQLD